MGSLSTQKDEYQKIKQMQKLVKLINKFNSVMIIDVWSTGYFDYF